MSTLPMTLSLVASFMSAITLLGVPAEVYTAGTQFAVSVLVYPLVMAIVIHFYLPVYDQLRLTTSYQYLQLRIPRPSVLCSTNQLTFIGDSGLYLSMGTICICLL